jgi:hypothetical protein
MAIGMLASTWNKGRFLADVVQIAAGTTVTVNSAGNNAKNVTINQEEHW